MQYSFRREVNRALAVLDTDRKGLARRLELSVGTLRSWEARGAPAYGRLLMAAIVAGIEPGAPFNGVKRDTGEPMGPAHSLISDTPSTDE